LNKEIEYNTSSKTNWFKDYMLTEEEKKKLIEDKIRRYCSLPSRTVEEFKKSTA